MEKTQKITFAIRVLTFIASGTIGAIIWWPLEGLMPYIRDIVPLPSPWNWIVWISSVVVIFSVVTHMTVVYKTNSGARPKALFSLPNLLLLLLCLVLIVIASIRITTIWKANHYNIYKNNYETLSTLEYFYMGDANIPYESFLAEYNATQKPKDKLYDEDKRGYAASENDRLSVIANATEAVNGTSYISSFMIYYENDPNDPAVEIDNGQPRLDFNKLDKFSEKLVQAFLILGLVDDEQSGHSFLGETLYKYVLVALDREGEVIYFDSSYDSENIHISMTGNSTGLLVLVEVGSYNVAPDGTFDFRAGASRSGKYPWQINLAAEPNETIYIKIRVNTLTMSETGSTYTIGIDYPKNVVILGCLLFSNDYYDGLPIEITPENLEIATHNINPSEEAIILLSAKMPSDRYWDVPFRISISDGEQTEKITVSIRASKRS